MLQDILIKVLTRIIYPRINSVPSGGTIHGIHITLVRVNTLVTSKVTIRPWAGRWPWTVATGRWGAWPSPVTSTRPWVVPIVTRVAALTLVSLTSVTPLTPVGRWSVARGWSALSGWDRVVHGVTFTFRSGQVTVEAGDSVIQVFDWGNVVLTWSQSWN